MRVISDFAGLQAVAPLVDAETGRKETNAKPALFQPAVLFQPALQRQTVLDAPDTPLGRDEVPGLARNNVSRILASNTSTPTGAPIGTAPLDPPAGGPTTLPNVDTMPFFSRGQGGASGTSTLSEIMSYLGKPVSPADIDNAIRRTGIELAFAPEDMIDFARENGLKAEGYNNGTLDEVKSMIDAGHPVQALLNNGDYLNITGYGTDPNTGEEYVTYHDPSLGTDQHMSVSDFEKKWGPANDGLIHIDGFKNYFIAYGDQNARLPPGRDDGIEGMQGYKNGAANLANGIDRIIHPDSWGGVVHGIFQTVGGFPQTLGSYFGAGLQAGAQWLNDEVNGIPVLQNFVQPVGDLVNGIGASIGDMSNSVGESWDDIGGAIEDLSHGDGGKFVHRLGDAAMDIGGGVVDAGSDVVSAVGDAISDLLSW